MVSNRTATEPGPSAAAPKLPAGTRVYAVGDIHGCTDLLRELHDAILEDVERSAPARRVAVYLGDYVDRGPDPRGALDILIEAPLPGFETVHLIGNHEEFLIRFLEEPATAPLWMMNGGDATCRSYGADPDAAGHGGDRFESLRRALKAALPETHLEFLAALTPSHAEGDYFFAHAGVRPGLALDAQVEQDLLWIREPFLSSAEDFGKVVVHGHTPTREPVLRTNRIGVDTGACYGGALTALVLEGEDRRFLQA